MENRLKERLTGAAILVALIVMLVPEMFRGQGGGATNTATSGSGADGSPVRSYTIDLSNNPKSNGPLQSTTESQSAAPAPPAPAPQPASQPASQPTPTPAPVAKASAPAPGPARAARATTAAAPALAPASPPKAASSGAWSVQLGIFAKRENAEKLMGEAKGKGFNVAVSSADAKGLFHVHSTGLPDRAAAQTLVQRLKGDGFQAAVVAPQ